MRASICARVASRSASMALRPWAGSSGSIWAIFARGIPDSANHRMRSRRAKCSMP